MAMAATTKTSQTGRLHKPAPFSDVAQHRRKRRLGDALGLTDYGVNLVVLPPGAESCLRHWHSHEDEFIYVLDGKITLVTNDGRQILGPGMAAGFPKGVANGHQLINEGATPARYLEIGSRAHADLVDYSDVDLRYSADSGFTDKAGVSSASSTGSSVPSSSAKD